MTTEPDVKPWPDPPNRCAFEDCQAGGVILPGAPSVVGGIGAGGGWVRSRYFHPGCWAAERRRREAA